MPRREEEEESEWTSRKEDILALYVEQDKPLSDVMHVMASRGFTRTKPQYERSFKKWRVSKNVRKKEWNFILGRLDERKRPTIVKVRGIVIPQARIEKQRLRKRETTFDLYKSRLRPKSRSRTPPNIEISTPRPTAEHDLQELSEEPVPDEHLDEEVPMDGRPQGPLVRAQEDDYVLSSAVTPPDITAVSDASDHIPTETPSGATRSPSPLSHSISDSTQRSCPQILYEYMRASIFVGDNELSSIIPIGERYRLHKLDKKPVEELLCHEYDQFLRSFVKHTLPKNDLYDVVRAFDTAEDMTFLRRLLLIAKLDAKWKSVGEDLLLYAAEDGNKRLVVMLLDVGVDINAFRPYNHRSHLGGQHKAYNPIQSAIHRGYNGLVDILTSHGASIFTTHRIYDCHFLAHASSQNATDLAKPLLAKVASSGFETAKNGVWILVIAVRLSLDKVVDILLDTGFNPYMCIYEHQWPDGDTYFESAFSVSLYTKKFSYLRAFLQLPYRGLDKKQCNERIRQLTAGYVGACCSKNVDIRNAIPDAQWRLADVKLVMGYDYVQSYLDNALRAAVKLSNCIKVKCLIQLGASPNNLWNSIISAHGKILLEFAVSKGDASIVRQLIAAEAETNAMGFPGYPSLLQRAVLMGSLDIVSLLVEDGAHVDMPLRLAEAGAYVHVLPFVHGLSAIETAATRGNLEMVAYLLEPGANIQGLHNKIFRRTLYRAQRNRHRLVVDLLQKWKRSRYGEEDCDRVSNIMSSMTWDELGFQRGKTMLDYYGPLSEQSDTESTMDSTDEE